MATDWEMRVQRAKHRPYRPLNETELAERDDAEIRNLHKAPPIARAHYTIVNNSYGNADMASSAAQLRHELLTRVLPAVI